MNNYSGRFDGVNGRVTIADNGFDGLAAGTVEFFFRVSPSIPAVFHHSMHKGGASFTFEGGLTDAHFPFGQIGGVGNLSIFAGNNLADGKRHHFCMDWDGTTLRGYIDGIQLINTPQLATQTNEAGALYIGSKDDNSEPWAGYIGEFRISNIARYATATSFTVPQAPFVDDANTLVLLHFNEGKGTSVADDSGNGNVGTIAGGAGFGPGFFSPLHQAKPTLRPRPFAPGLAR